MQEEIKRLKEMRSNLDSLKAQYLALVQTLNTLRTQIEQKSIEFENAIMALPLENP